MIVYFDKLTLLKQHGEIVECMHIECKSIDFVSNKAILKFGINDFSIVQVKSIIKIQ